MKHYLTMNGLEHAFLKEYGCGCARCARRGHVANTSASLISLADDGTTAHHILIDVGNGVVESMMGNPHLAGQNARLDWLLFTHWHSDHAMEVRRLGASWMRAQMARGQKPSRIATWARQGSAQWLAVEQAAAVRDHLAMHDSGETQAAGVVLGPVPIGMPDLSITPLTAYHSSADLHPANPSAHLPCCAGFVVQSETVKASLLWDLDASNDWILGDGEAQRLAADADLLFIDCNTWRQETHPVLRRSTAHASFFTVMRYAGALKAKRTYLVHLSGHEDMPGDGWGWDDAEWEANARRVWHASGAPGEVSVPRIGERFPL